MLILLNKPYGVLSQFTPEGRRAGLAGLVPRRDVYPAGRLDADSEGLLILTDDGGMQHRLTDPRHKLPKHYWVQVEGIPDARQIEALACGVELDGRRTLPAVVTHVPEPAWLWPRNPPVRQRRAIPTAWLTMSIREGRNRQIRRMTALVGLPTLRLVRERIGPWGLDGLQPGEWRDAGADPPH